ncbi:MAG: hypothetical protein LBI66_11165 [Burkholderiaceae bacterium]|jgi:hypothetical protein|nr:hypothetical protein [Burkholderiaceae bacterium]
MDVIASANHLLNFVAPALFLSVGLWLCARIFYGKSSEMLSWWVQIAINLIVGGAVLAAGLWWFGRDGKMATYTALVLVMALCQWVLCRGWR